MSKQDKVLLVLGASSDIGRRLIAECHSQYAQVLCHYRTSDDFLQQLAAQGADNLRGYRADLADVEDTRRLIQQIKDDGIAPDHILHLSAVPAAPVHFAKDDWSSFETMLAVSLRAAVLTAQAFIPAMAKQKYGKLVFMLTAYVQNVPPKYLAAYVSSKYALLGLMKSLAAEYAEKGIQVNGVSPEMIETKFLSGMSEYIVQANAQKSPRGRNLLVEEVTPTLRFLLSEASDGITGENIVITGGKA